MSQDQWTAVDSYIEGLLHPSDNALQEALADSEAGGLPSIAVSAAQGQMLQLLALMSRAKSILEIGTLGGYSTICLARALPSGGRLISLEYAPKHAAVARNNVARAGLAHKVDIRVGRAAESLETLIAEGAGPFDFVFIDADKVGYPEYFRQVLKLSHPGTVIVADNIVRQGAVADPETTDQTVRAVREFNRLVAAEKRVRSTIVQTVGAKGYDGFLLAVVTKKGFFLGRQCGSTAVRSAGRNGLAT